MARSFLVVLAGVLVASGCSSAKDDGLGSSEDQIGTADVASCAPPREVVTVDGLNVRRCEPGAPVDTSCAKVATLAVGHKVRYLGVTAGAWVNIAVDDLGLESVWAHADYLTCAGAGAPGPAPAANGPIGFDVRFDSPDGRARLEAQEDDVPVTVTIAGTAYRGARIELHGATSLAYPKKSYDLKFGKCVDGSKNEGCEKGKKPKVEANLYGGDGTKSIDKVVLNASWIDGTMMRNPLAYALARDLGALAPRTGWATLAFEGQAHGYYQAIEPVNDGDFFDRRDVAWGGSLYKATQHRSWDPNGDPFVSTDNGPAFKVSDGPGSREELSAFFRDVQGRSVGDAAGVLDLEDYLRFHMVQSFVFNKDTFTKNYFLYRTPNAPWRMVFWDCDTTFGQDWQDGHRTNPDEDWYFGGQMGEFANRFVGDNNVNYLGRFRRELAGGVLSISAVDQRVDALAAAIRGPVGAEVASRGKSFDDELAWLKEAMHRRHAKLSEKIEGECRYRPCP